MKSNALLVCVQSCSVHARLRSSSKLKQNSENDAVLFCCDDLCYMPVACQQCLSLNVLWYYVLLFMAKTWMDSVTLLIEPNTILLIYQAI